MSAASPTSGSAELPARRLRATPRGPDAILPGSRAQVRADVPVASFLEDDDEDDLDVTRVRGPIREPGLAEDGGWLTPPLAEDGDRLTPALAEDGARLTPALDTPVVPPAPELLERAQLDFARSAPVSNTPAPPQAPLRSVPPAVVRTNELAELARSLEADKAAHDRRGRPIVIALTIVVMVIAVIGFAAVWLGSPTPVPTP